ncbi:hypothetical protein AmDm5_0079 [Acetobacter malorum]|nr:hypothetical protein AmDm5_0079 [Acetobacter malorum]
MLADFINFLHRTWLRLEILRLPGKKFCYFHNKKSTARIFLRFSASDAF